MAQMQQKRNAYLQQAYAFIDQAPQRLEEIGSLICDASSYCDICEYPELCQAMRVETNHLQLVANITRPQIESLGRSGVKTVAQLAQFTGSTDKLSEEQIERLSRQARLQQGFYDSGERKVEVIDPAALDILGE